jgi:hypothetical protein
VVPYSDHGTERVKRYAFPFFLADSLVAINNLAVGQLAKTLVKDGHRQFGSSGIDIQ